MAIVRISRARLTVLNLSLQSDPRPTIVRSLRIARTRKTNGEGNIRCVCSVGGEYDAWRAPLVSMPEQCAAPVAGMCRRSRHGGTPDGRVLTFCFDIEPEECRLVTWAGVPDETDGSVARTPGRGVDVEDRAGIIGRPRDAVMTGEARTATLLKFSAEVRHFDRHVGNPVARLEFDVGIWKKSPQHQCAGRARGTPGSGGLTHATGTGDQGRAGRRVSARPASRPRSLIGGVSGRRPTRPCSSAGTDGGPLRYTRRAVEADASRRRVSAASGGACRILRSGISLNFQTLTAMRRSSGTLRGRRPSRISHI